MSVPGAV